ncbi:MAG: hypothetical protein ABSB23_08550 [Bryobacteraceae bacterium]|jgi:hypothetical protein
MKTRLPILAVAAAACLAAQAQAPGPSKQDQEHARAAAPPAETPITFRGILIDAGCRDFSRFNLHHSPQALPAPPGDTNAKAAASGSTASGITVDANTLDAERADVMPHQIADLVSRQSDPTCAIKGNTHAYALLLADGRVTDLDEGGNTFADAAVKADERGRAMLAGQGPGFKPIATVTGRVQGSRIVASAVKIEPK